MTNYYQVKMTKCDGRSDDYTVEDIRNILLSSNPYIGVNEWYNPNGYSCDDFKNIQPSDIVLVANGRIGVAIVRVISNNYTKKENEDGFVNRKSVKVIKLLNEKESELPAKSQKSRTVIKSGMNIEYMKNLLNNSKENVSLTANMKKIINDSKDLLDKKKQIILYGSAGTGKTYNTKNIIEEHSGENYEDLKKSGRVEFVTFHQSFAYEDFIEGIKPNLDNKDISYFIEDGIFKKLVIDAEENYKNSQKKEEKFKTDELLKIKFYSFINESLENQTKFIKTQGGEFSIIDINDNHIVILSDDSKHSEGKLLIPIRDVNIVLEFDKRNELKSSRGYALEIFKKKSQRQIDTYIFKIFEQFDSWIHHNRQEDNLEISNNNLKRYYLIIDEINRGNISKIFGELITLLEANKRLGEKNELTTTLPYSKEEFGIPPNLYIIGTMNTSDKSIAHLDIALRRRFGFVEMLPDYEVITDDKCKELLQKLNERIEILLDKDHLIGHSFFIDKTEDDISQIMQYEIVPLLEEYFYGDYEKIQLVLKDTDYKLFDSEKEIPEELKQYTNKDKLYQYWFESIVNDEQ